MLDTLKRWLHSDSFWKRTFAVWVHTVAAAAVINTTLFVLVVVITLAR